MSTYGIQNLSGKDTVLNIDGIDINIEGIDSINTTTNETNELILTQDERGDGLPIKTYGVYEIEVICRAMSTQLVRAINRAVSKQVRATLTVAPRENEIDKGGFTARQAIMATSSVKNYPGDDSQQDITFTMQLSPRNFVEYDIDGDKI